MSATPYTAAELAEARAAHRECRGCSDAYWLATVDAAEARAKALEAALRASGAAIGVLLSPHRNESDLTVIAHAHELAHRALSTPVQAGETRDNLASKLAAECMEWQARHNGFKCAPMYDIKAGRLVCDCGNSKPLDAPPDVPAQPSETREDAIEACARALCAASECQVDAESHRHRAWSRWTTERVLDGTDTAESDAVRAAVLAEAARHPILATGGKK